MILRDFNILDIHATAAAHRSDLARAQTDDNAP